MAIFKSGNYVGLWLLAVLLPCAVFAQWFSGAWPTNGLDYAQFGGVPGEYTNTSAFVTNQVPPLTNSGAVVSSGMYCPTGGIWFSTASRSDIWVKVTLEPLPGDYTNSALVSNLCISPAVDIVVAGSTNVYGSVTNITSNTTNTIPALTNVLMSGTLDIFQFRYSDEPSTFTVTTNTSYCVTGGVTNYFSSTYTNVTPIVTNFSVNLVTSKLVSNLPPAEHATLATNVQVRSLMVDLLASLRNPGRSNYYGSFSWTSNSTSIAYLETNLYQFISAKYIGSTNFNATNACLRLAQAWGYDATLAEGERWSISGEIGNAPVLGISANAADFAGLSEAKARLVNAGSPYVIKEFSASGSFNDWCSPLAQPAPEFKEPGYLWDGSTIIDNTGFTNAGKYWPGSVTVYRPLPRWDLLSASRASAASPNNGWYLVGAGGSRSCFFVPDDNSYVISNQMNYGREYLRLNLYSLPHWERSVVVTNYAWPQRSGSGVQMVYKRTGTIGSIGEFTASPTTNNTILPTFVTSNKVILASYFDYTPAKAYTAPDLGLGNLVTNVWEFDNKWLWWGNFRQEVSMGATNNYLLVNGVPQGSMKGIVTNLNMVYTNQLSVAGKTDVRFYTQYWVTNDYKGYHAEAYDSSAFYTLKANALTNYITVTTQKWPVVKVPFNCVASFYVTNHIFNNITNLLTNAVMTCYYTNVSSIGLNVYRVDWAGATNVATNTVIWPVTTPVTNNLLNLTITKPNLRTNVVSVFTNWAVAPGYHEVDYGWDGVRKVLNGLTWTVAAPAGYGGEANMVNNMLVTNKVSSLANTNLLGTFSWAGYADTVALAETNSPSVSHDNGLPGASRYVDSSTGYYRKDVWNLTGDKYSGPIGDWTVCLSWSYYDFSYTNCFDMGDPETCYVEVQTYCGCDSYSTFTVSDGADLVTVYEAIQDNQPTMECTASDWPFYYGVDDYGARISKETFNQYLEFWHTAEPAQESILVDCEAGGVARYVDLTFTKVSNDVHNASNLAYVGDTDPAIDSIISKYLATDRSSKFLALNSLSKYYGAERELYLSGAVQSRGGQYNTTVLPVALTITTNNYTFAEDPTLYVYIITDERLPHYYDGTNWVYDYEHEGPCTIQSDFEGVIYEGGNGGAITNDVGPYFYGYRNDFYYGVALEQMYMKKDSFKASQYATERPFWGNVKKALHRVTYSTFPDLVISNTLRRPPGGTMNGGMFDPADYRFNYRWYVDFAFVPNTAWFGAFTTNSLTNAAWSNNGYWDSSEMTANIIDEASGAGKWYMVDSDAIAQTNLYYNASWATTNMFKAGSTNEYRLDYWSVGGALLLLKWDKAGVTNSIRWK